MSDDLYNIDDLFKKALEEHTELSSSAVWDNIDKSLDKKKVVSISKKYNKLKWAAAALLLFSVGMAMYVLHIRIKDKELVKQHNAGKNLENQKVHAKNNPEDSANLAREDDNKPAEAKTGNELKNSNNNTAAISGTKNYTPPGKNTTGNITQRNKQSPYHKEIKPGSEGTTAAHIIKQDQKELPLKNKAGDKTSGKKMGSNLANNEKSNILKSIAPGNDKGMRVNKGLQQKPDDTNISSDEKYAPGIAAISQTKEGFRLLTIKPVSQIPGISINNIIPLKSNEFAKRTGTTALKQHNMKNNNSSLLSATIFFSPDLVSTNLRNNHPLFREEDRDEIEKDEKIKYSNTLGVLIDYVTGKNWKIESGVTFSTRFTNIQPKTIYARPDNSGNINYRFNCSAGYSFVTLKSTGMQPVSGDSIRALTSKNILKYMGIPVVVKYVLGTGRFTVTTGIGISANFLTRGKIETTIPTATGNQSITSNDIRGLKSTYFDGLVSAGAQYKLNKNFEFTLMPAVHFALSSINKEAPVKTYLNSVGLGSGIIIKL